MLTTVSVMTLQVKYDKETKKTGENEGKLDKSCKTSLEKAGRGAENKVRNEW